MLRTITIKDITHRAASTIAGVANRPFQENDSEIGDEGEDDGVAVAPAPATQEWTPNSINIDMIRNWTPRAQGREGCRIILKSGTAYVALDTHDEIAAKIAEAQRS